MICEWWRQAGKRARTDTGRAPGGLFLGCLCAASGAWAGEAGDEPVLPEPGRGDFVSIYYGESARDRLIEILRDWSPEFQDSYLVAATWTRPFAHGRHTRWEIEGQLVRHGGLQHHWEINVVPVVRWMTTPWDHWVDTRFAAGWGLSWASRVPEIEPRAREPDSDPSAQLLSYNLFEIELAPPGGNPAWSGYLRVHHRSGVGGLFSGVKGGSNFVGVGLRYYYDRNRGEHQ